MAKKNKKSHKEEKTEKLHHDTKLSAIAIIFIGLAVVLLLASFGQGGPVGGFIYNNFQNLLGLGYYLIPLILILISVMFLTGDKRTFLSITLAGAGFFVIAGLGLLDIVYPGEGGLLGRFFGGLESFFGYYASLILNFAILISSLIITLNIPLKINLKKNLDDLSDRKKEQIQEVPKIINNNGTNNEEEEEDEADNKSNNKKGAEEKREENKIDDVKIAEAKNKKPASLGKPAKMENYKQPPVTLLRSTSEKPTVGDLRANANIIKRTLESFGIPVEMGEITIGPKVTRYTLKPAEGVKISKITTLNQDLALALAAHPIRIEAPIPGKSLVGIELPNKTASIVRLGSLLSYPEFTNSAPLTFALGRDVSGEPIFTNLAKMPHMLIAGTTGSGKSVAIHSLIISLLYKNSPAMLRLILIDPKRVELSVYEGMPHLVSSVITEGKKAVAALRFGIDEMDRRYETLLKAGCRDILSYNEKNKEEKMPYLVIIIDELADLMSQFGREIEGSIVRLAQMARATGIHLVVSTQRPSVEVITGLIKANITARVALQVPSQVDSRTILDMAGAEKLLGGGDMLFISSDLSKPKRIQGGYITDEEIEKVTSFIKKENISEEKDDSVKIEIEENLGKESFDNYVESSDDDELFDQAVNVVKEADKASASLLQRRLSVGYARAARLLDIMEERGIIGPGKGAKPREVFVTNNDESQHERKEQTS
jgi:S-DNA-T family DNA segregation ATPase FtsK/SpoIIIE